MTIPEALFGAFVENALPELKRFAEVSNEEIIDRFVTLPFVGKLGARCPLSYLDGELEASLFFSYDGQEVPARFEKLTFDEIKTFVPAAGGFSSQPRGRTADRRRAFPRLRVRRPDFHLSCED